MRQTANYSTSTRRCQAFFRSGCNAARATGGLWIPPEVLASLRPQQVIERHELVGTTTAVSGAGAGSVTISETGPLHRVDCTYDAGTGILSALTLTQQIGLASITHSVRLAGRQ